MPTKSLFLVLTLTVACAPSSSDKDNPANLIAKEGIRHDIEVLSADSMQGRRAGTAGEEMARNYIVSRFEEIGLAPVNGSYLHEVALTGQQKIAGGSSLTFAGPNGNLAYTNEQTFTYWSTQPGEPVCTVAASAARLASERLTSKTEPALESLTIKYVRKSEAEINYEKKYSFTGRS